MSRSYPYSYNGFFLYRYGVPIMKCQYLIDAMDVYRLEEDIEDVMVYEGGRAMARYKINIHNHHEPDIQGIAWAI